MSPFCSLFIGRKCPIPFEAKQYENSDVQKIPYSNALKQSLERGVYMFEAGPESDLVSQVITNYIQQFWNNKLTAEEALTKAQEDIINGRAEIFRNL